MARKELSKRKQYASCVLEMFDTLGRCCVIDNNAVLKVECSTAVSAGVEGVLEKILLPFLIMDKVVQ